MKVSRGGCDRRALVATATVGDDGYFGETELFAAPGDPAPPPVGAPVTCRGVGLLGEVLTFTLFAHN